MPEPARFLWLPGWSVGPDVWGPALGGAPEGEHAACDFGACEQAGEIPAAALAALDALPGPAVLVGWSLGALVALGLARDRPERVRGLLLAGATARFAGEGGWPESVLRRMSDRLADDPRAVLGAFDRRMFSPAERREGLDGRWAAAMRAGPPQPVSALRAGLDFLAGFAADPGTVTAPVSLLHGSEDAICPPAAARALAAELPDARLTVLEGAGHAPFWTQPERFREWLSA